MATVGNTTLLRENEKDLPTGKQLYVGNSLGGGAVQRSRFTFPAGSLQIQPFLWLG